MTFLIPLAATLFIVGFIVGAWLHSRDEDGAIWWTLILTSAVVAFLWGGWVFSTFLPR
jgi:xanthine/uracil/vitamin C permease (AzgA family)